MNLAQLKKLAEAATPGEWVISDSPEGTHIFSKSEARKLGVGKGQLIPAVAIVCKEFGQPFEANRAFIAASRTAIPKLCDLVEALVNAAKSQCSMCATGKYRGYPAGPVTSKGYHTVSCADCKTPHDFPQPCSLSDELRQALKNLEEME